MPEVKEVWDDHNKEVDEEWTEHKNFHKIPSPMCHYCMSNADE